MRRTAASVLMFLGLVAWLSSEKTEPRSLPPVRVPSVEKTAVLERPKEETTTVKQGSPDAFSLIAQTELQVRGKRVAFRTQPNKNAAIIDRFNSGDIVVLIERQMDWSKVVDPLSQREGWIANHLLVPNSAAKPRATSKPKPAIQPVPEISDAEITQKIIANSISRYRGSCPCPYNTDRAGRSCGRRSAYSKPGGAAPLCFEEDVSEDMISQMRKRMN